MNASEQRPHCPACGLHEPCKVCSGKTHLSLAPPSLPPAYLLSAQGGPPVHVPEALVPVVKEAQRLGAEVERLTKLAYLGDHHFPDLTWKARCEEAVADLRASEAKLDHVADFIFDLFDALATEKRGSA